MPITTLNGESNDVGAVRPNEGKACDAIIRILEGRTGQTRQDLRVHADAGNGKNVEARFHLADQEYAIEHTRINSFKNQVRVELLFQQFARPILEKLSGKLPGPGYWKLGLPSNIGRRIKRRDVCAVQAALIEWLITATTELPFVGSSRIPTGLNFKVTLMYESNRVGSGLLLILPEESMLLDEHRTKQLAVQLEQKCPKLQSCKNVGATSVLILETNDRTTWHGVLVPELQKALTVRQDAPDEVYLIDTITGSFWMVLPLWCGGKPQSDQVAVEVNPELLVDITAPPLS